MLIQMPVFPGETAISVGGHSAVAVAELGVNVVSLPGLKVTEARGPRTGD